MNGRILLIVIIWAAVLIWWLAGIVDRCAARRIERDLRDCLNQPGDLLLAVECPRCGPITVATDYTTAFRLLEEHNASAEHHRSVTR